MAKMKKKADTGDENTETSTGRKTEEVSAERKRNRIRGMSKQARMQLARTTSDPEILKILADDIDESVRESVASNKRCTGDILSRLRMDPIVRVSVAAVETFRAQSTGMERERQKANQKMLEAINEDENVEERIRMETEKMLTENTIPSSEQLRMEIGAGLAGFFQNNPEFTEYEIALREGILLGGMLEGAYDYAIDLAVANRTGMNVDDAYISREQEYDLDEQIDEPEIEAPARTGSSDIER